MARSYKHVPYCGDRKTFGKKMANRKIRRLPVDDEHIYNHSSYKKLYEQYNVCDWYSINYTFDDCLKYEWDWYNWKYKVYGCAKPPKPDNEKILYRRWYTRYKMK